MSKAPKNKVELSKQDASLWERVKQTITPIKGRDTLDIEIREDFGALFEGKGKPAQPGPKSKDDHHILHMQPHDEIAHADKMPSLQSYSHKEKRKLSRGIQKIEAQLDLHGLREHEARAALESFIGRCYSQNKRHLLVITGKGTRLNKGPDTRPFDMGERTPGVLRRKVPSWLEGGALGHMVLSYTVSARHHGGDGALYVRLRKKK